MVKFMRLMEAVKEYPYTKPFTLSEVFPGWEELKEKEQKDLKRQFAAYVQSIYEISIEDKGEDHLNDLDFTYTKSINDDFDMGNFDDAVKTALSLKTLEQGREFILPEIEREEDNMYGSDIRSNLDTENALNELINKGYIPFLAIVGKSYGFTVYKRL